MEFLDTSLTFYILETQNLVNPAQSKEPQEQSKGKSKLAALIEVEEAEFVEEPPLILTPK